ncbi:MAG: pilin [bacterium]
MQKTKKIITLCAVLCATGFIIAPLFVKANLSDNVWGGVEGSGTVVGNDMTEIGMGNKDPREIIASIIKIVLGFLGIIAVVIILVGGFKWMTAGGNEDQVGEAKKWIYSGVVGLLIVLASYALANFVLTQLMDVTEDDEPVGNALIETKTDDGDITVDGAE